MLVIAIASDVSAAPGQLDPTFGVGGKTVVAPFSGAALAAAMTLATNGNILTAGTTYQGPSFSAYNQRSLPNGSLDPSFAPNGGYVGTTLLNSVALAPDGTSITGGSCSSGGIFGKTDFCVIRRTVTGSLDATWNTTGIVQTAITTGNNSATKVLIQGDGKVLAAGNCTTSGNVDFCIARYMSNGTLDSAFNATGFVVTGIGPASDTVVGAALQADGKLVVAGTCSNGVDDDFCAARYKTDGSLDVSFNGIGKRIISSGSGKNAARDIVLDASEKIVVGGTCSFGVNDRFCVIRLNPDGSTDASFAANGVLDTTTVATAGADIRVAIQPDGKIVLAMECTPGTFGDFCVSRYLSGGILDTTFGQGGVQTIDIAAGRDRVSGIAIQQDGKTVVAGVCDTTSYTGFCLARLKGGPYDPLTCALNADANNIIESSTDALLILRYLLGYRGDTLTNGSLGSNPTRTGTALETYLASLNLDADGDGQINAMTDGLLILRAMLGLSGNALTAGAVNTSSPNVRNAQQILTWIETTHGAACLP